MVDSQRPFGRRNKIRPGGGCEPPPTELRLTQSPDGSVDTTEHDPEALRRRVNAITRVRSGPEALTSTQEQEYIDALCDEIVVWADAGYPAGDGLIEAFRLLP